MAPNFKEFDDCAETDGLLRNVIFYEDLKPVQNSKKRKRAGGPDGCRAWTVALANFFINFIVVGLGRMSGILYVAFMHMFHVDRKTASMPFSIQQAARHFFGPLAGILGQKYGVRNVTLIGGVIGTFSSMACYFAMSMSWITVLWGLVFGLSTALTTTLNQVPIDQWFEKYRTTAGGLAFSGGCVAAFIFPVVLEYLIPHYGMNKTFHIMGCFIFLVIPASFTLTKPAWKKEKEIQEKIEQDRNAINLYRPNTYNTFEPVILNKNEKTIRQPIDFEFLKQNSEFVYQLFVLTIPDDVISCEGFSETLWNFADTLPLVNELKDLHNYLQQVPENKITSEANNEDLTHSIHVVEVTINGFPKQNSTDSVNFEKENEILTPQNHESYAENSRWLYLSIKLQELCLCKEKALLLYFPTNVHMEIIKILNMLNALNDLRAEKDKSAIIDQPVMPDIVDEPIKRKRSAKNVMYSNSFIEHLKTAFRLHKNPLFLLICLCRGVFMLTFITLVIIIVDFAMDKGLQQSSGKYVIAILSLGDLLGRLCLGWIIDVGILSLPNYMLVVMLLLSVSTATLPLMHSEVTLIPAILVFGMLQGSLFTRHQVLVSKYMDTNEQAIGMGFINFLSGFIGFALPFYIGYFRDSQGSYDNMFYLNGTICAVIGILWIFEPFLSRFAAQKAKTYETM